MMRPVFLAAAAALIAAPAWAGPAHVLSSRLLGPVPASATYAIAPTVDASTREVLPGR